MRCISVTNQKGGVAKTTTVRALGAALGRRDQRVLVVDLDPQANLTAGVGIDFTALPRSMYHVLVHKHPITDITRSTREGFDIAPSDEALMRAEMEMAEGRLGWVRELHKALDPVRGDYDWCLFDTPPIRGFLTVNALVAADHGVIVPFVPERDAVMGMQLLSARMEELMPANPSLRIITCVPCMVDRHWKVHTETMDAIGRHFPELHFSQPIMRHADFPRAAGVRMNILDFAPKSGGARAYNALADLILTHSRPPAPVPVA